MEYVETYKNWKIYRSAAGEYIAKKGNRKTHPRTSIQATKNAINAMGW